MTSRNTLAVFAAMCLFYNIGDVQGYEDLTHQQLSKRAVQVAGQNAAGVPADILALFVDSQGNIKDLGLQVIAGAGQGPEGRGQSSDNAVASDGEDYTRYDLKWEKCPKDPVTPHVYPKEPTNHFTSGIPFCGKPAIKRFKEFYRDAVALWRKGFKDRAAFILGRAVHLVEDMAQPQHAMDEMS